MIPKEVQLPSVIRLLWLLALCDLEGENVRNQNIEHTELRENYPESKKHKNRGLSFY